MTAKRRKSPKPTICRTIKQVRQAGLEVRRIEVEPGGKIIVVTGKSDDGDVEQNPWDEVYSKNAADQKRPS